MRLYRMRTKTHPDGPRPTVVHADDCPLERWDDPTRGGVVWRTLLCGDRTPTRGLTLGVAEFPPGGTGSLRPHRHAPPEAYYVLDGQGVVTIDGVEHPVRAGTAVYLPGDATHAVINTGPTPLRLVYVFPVDGFPEVEYHFD